jgi:hypothetical protein
MRIITRDSIYSLQLTDDNGNIYYFDDCFFIDEDAIDARSALVDRAYANGGIETADGMSSGRKITINGKLARDDQDDFETAMRQLVVACRKGGLLSIANDTVSRSIDVRNAKIKSEWIRYPLARDIQIDFIAAFPYWQDTTYTDDTEVVAGDDTLTVDASDSDHIMMPIITIDADQAADVTAIRIKNLDDGGVVFEYQNPLFVVGSQLIIDSETGYITMNGNDAREFIIEGSAFLRLQPMENNLEYEGSACTITVSFRRLYA